ERMSDLYGEILKGRNQFDIYSKITMNCKNVVTLISDSKNVVLPCDKVCFAYIDGNHSPDYVRNDFYLVWNKLVSHGVVSFDDYGYDLPQVTKTIHKLIGEESERILKLWTAGGKRIFIEKE
ncbi:MAG TPA: class I SAM-dependent methyltransferase, partial [Fervidobacterium sp.]|nr:class I SAM-dependent methyltransferase [Fervidobacterium sp.]